jgi:hypothetical protein
LIQLFCNILASGLANLRFVRQHRARQNDMAELKAAQLNQQKAPSSIMIPTGIC